MKKTLLLLLPALAMWLGSCSSYADLQFPDEDSEFAVPLVEAKTSIQKLFQNFDDQSLLVINPDGTVELNYKGNVTTRSSLDLFASLQNTLWPIPDTANVLPVAFPDGVRLDYAILKSGTVKYALYNEFGEAINVKFTVPQLTLNGAPFEHQFTAFPSFPAIGQVDVTGYVLNPENDTIRLNYEAYKSNGERVKFANFAIQLIDFQAWYAEGYLGSQLYDLDPDTILIDYLKKIQQGDISFVNPTIKLTVDNSFGFPVHAIPHFVNVISVDNSVLPLESPYIGAGIDFDYPSLSEVGQTKTHSFYFDNTNSNISQILSSKPIAVAYDIDALSNPDSNVNLTGFITDTSFMRVGVEVNLPLWGSAKDFYVNDTFDLNLDIPDKADYAEFKIVTDNQIPMDISLQLYMENENGQIIDSLFSQEELLLQSAPVNSEGVSNGTSTRITYADIEKARFPHLRNTKKLIGHIRFSTFNNGAVPIKVISTNELSFRIGMRIGIKK